MSFVGGAVERARTKVTAGLALSAVLLGISGLVLAKAEAGPLFSAVTALALASYALTRRSLPNWAAPCAVLAFAIVPYWGLFTASAETSAIIEIAMMIVSGLAAGLCLRQRQFIVFGLLHLALIGGLLAQNPGIPTDTGLEAWGVLALVMVLTFIHVRIRVSNEAELETQRRLSEDIVRAVAAGAAEREQADKLRTLNAQLVQAQAQLVQAAKLAAMGELAAGVAHEINNPLTAVMTYTALLSKEPLTVEKRARYLANISDAAERCAVVVRGLLEFGRRSSGANEVVDLRKVVDQAITLVKPQLDMMGASVTRDITEPMTVYGNANQLGQVVVNLVLNAGHAVDGSGRITLTGYPDGDKVRLSIRDDGHGIAPHARERLFEPFFSTREAGVGTGLGLPVSLGLVQEHGGKILVDSVAGEGAVFTVVLPAHEAQAVAVPRKKTVTQQ